MSDEAGFTLVEALIALLILAIASAGLIGAVETHVDSIRGLEQRTIAQWVAENQLAEMRLAGNALPSQETVVRMLDRDWRVTTRTASAQDADLRQVTVEVAPSPGRAPPLVALRGFLDAGTTTP